jgi:hypothetical protein
MLDSSRNFLIAGLEIEKIDFGNLSYDYCVHVGAYKFDKSLYTTNDPLNGF